MVAADIDSDMEDVVALSKAVRDRHHSITPSTIDDIPELTRALSQVHADSTRLLTPYAAADNQVHPAALRLFASVGFQVDRLERAISSIDTNAFVDKPIRPHAPFRQPLWLAGRALDDARLRMNEALRQSTAITDRELLAADNQKLVEKLAALRRAQPDQPSPPKSPPRTPHTPFSPDVRIPRKHRLSSTPSATPSLHISPTPVHAYVDTISAIALHGDAPSAPSSMHEAAASVSDVPHFVEALAILSSVSRHANPANQPLSDFAVWGARVVLEDSFGEQIPGLPPKPRLAAPTVVLQKITDFVRDKIPRSMGVFWPSIFLCLRIGHVQAAVEAVAGVDSSRVGFAKHVGYFRSFLKGREIVRKKFLKDHDQRVSSEITSERRDDLCMPISPGCLCSEEEYQALALDYREDAWKSENPYMKACYVLLARLELLSEYQLPGNVLASQEESLPYPRQPKDQRYSLAFTDDDMSVVFGSIEDFMWMRLWLCRTPSESELQFSPSTISYVSHKQLQEEVVSCGSHHFDPSGSQPLLYAFILVSVGLYDDAVAYLASHPNDSWMHYGIHLAIVLYHLNWIEREDHFHSILMKYVSMFSRLNPAAAALYLANLKDRQLLKEYLKELVVTTGEYTSLLGRSDVEMSEKGILEELIDTATVPLLSGFSKADLNDVRVEAATHGAQEAVLKKEFAAAAQMYKLAGKTNEALEMITTSLAEEVDKLSSSQRPLAVAEAKNALRLVESRTSLHPSEETITSLRELVKISKVFEEYWTGRYGSAWASLREVNVLPMSPERISNCRRKFTHGGDGFSSYLYSCTTELLKVALHIAEYALETGSVVNPDCEHRENVQLASGVQPKMPEYAEIKSLCIFAGMLGDFDSIVSERLVRIELLLT